jgi:hypothetical protein
MAGATEQRAAVFTRNHIEHLRRAAQISAAYPTALVVFRSQVRWSGAREALAEQGSVTLYIATVGGGDWVEYIGELVELHLDPKDSDPRVAELLRAPSATNSNEGLWGYAGGVQSLYVMRRCQLLDNPFRMSELVKVKDGIPPSPDYGYSYSLVRERPEAAPAAS